MSIHNPDLSPANAGLFIQQKLLKPPSTDPGTVRRTGRSNSRLLARTIRRDLVRPVEQLRIYPVAHNQPIYTVLAGTSALVTSDAQSSRPGL